MVVQSQVTSEVAAKAQRGNLEFLLINHPLDCPVCDKGGECPLQNQSMTHGAGESRFVETKRTFPKPIKVSEQVLLDRERCVLCARCTRFSEQIAGDPFIELMDRGSQQQVGIYEEQPFSSYFSGNTIQICPVGALTSADYRFRSRPFDLVSTPSIAEHDSSGSAIRIDHRRGKVMRRLAGDDPEVNEEWITDKDRFCFTYATEGDRLTHAAGARRARRAAARLVARRPRRRRRGTGRCQGQGRRAARRPTHRRGRLRLLHVRARRARHPRHRLPLPCALRRRGRVPRLARRRHAARRHLRGSGACLHGRARRPGARGRGRHRVPAAASRCQGVRRPDRVGRQSRHPWPGQDGR